MPLDSIFLLMKHTKSPRNKARKKQSWLTTEILQRLEPAVQNGDIAEIKCWLPQIPAHDSSTAVQLLVHSCFDVLLKTGKASHIRWFCKNNKHLQYNDEQLVASVRAQQPSPLILEVLLQAPMLNFWTLLASVIRKGNSKYIIRLLHEHPLSTLPKDVAPAENAALRNFPLVLAKTKNFGDKKTRQVLQKLHECGFQHWNIVAESLQAQNPDSWLVATLLYTLLQQEKLSSAMYVLQSGIQGMIYHNSMGYDYIAWDAERFVKLITTPLIQTAAAQQQRTKLALQCLAAMQDMQNEAFQEHMEHLVSSLQQHSLVEWRNVAIDAHGNGLLHYSMKHKSVEFIMDAYVKRLNMSVNAANHLRQTPLMLAAFYGNIPMVKALLEAGANPNAMDGMHNNTYVHYLGMQPSMLRDPEQQLAACIAAGPWAQVNTMNELPLHAAAVKMHLAFLEAHPASGNQRYMFTKRHKRTGYTPFDLLMLNMDNAAQWKRAHACVPGPRFVKKTLLHGGYVTREAACQYLKTCKAQNKQWVRKTVLIAAKAAILGGDLDAFKQLPLSMMQRHELSFTLIHWLFRCAPAARIITDVLLFLFSSWQGLLNVKENQHFILRQLCMRDTLPQLPRLWKVLLSHSSCRVEEDGLLLVQAACRANSVKTLHILREQAFLHYPERGLVTAARRNALDVIAYYLKNTSFPPAVIAKAAAAVVMRDSHHALSIFHACKVRIDLSTAGWVKEFLQAAQTTANLTVWYQMASTLLKYHIVSHQEVFEKVAKAVEEQIMGTKECQSD